MDGEYDWLTLDADEEIIWSGQPSKKSMYGAYLIGIPLILALGLGLLIVIPAHLQRTNTDYVITTKGVYKKTGIMSRSVTEIEFDKVQNTTFSAGAVGRYFGYGTVGISTAGGSGVEMQLRGVEDPQSVQKQLSRRVKQAQREGVETAGEETKGDVLDDILAELRAIRQALETGSGTAAGSRWGDAGVETGSGDADSSLDSDSNTSGSWDETDPER